MDVPPVIELDISWQNTWNADLFRPRQTFTLTAYYTYITQCHLHQAILDYIPVFHYLQKRMIHTPSSFAFSAVHLSSANVHRKYINWEGNIDGISYTITSNWCVVWFVNPLTLWVGHRECVMQLVLRLSEHVYRAAATITPLSISVPDKVWCLSYATHGWVCASPTHVHVCGQNNVWWWLYVCSYFNMSPVSHLVVSVKCLIHVYPW